MAYEMQAVTLTKLYDVALARLASATQIATTAIQSLLLMNGGAIVAVIGLLAQGRDAPIMKNVYLPTVIWGVVAFAAAAASTLAAAILGHNSQARMSGIEEAEARRFYETGQLGFSTDEAKKLKFADGLLTAGIIFVASALFLFIIGAALVAWAFLAAR